jgi:AsmA protein
MSRATRIELIVLTVIVAVVGAVYLIPLNTYRAPLAAAASRALSREVRIGGPVHLSIYPSLGLSLSDVSIANVPGARDPQMIGIEKLTVGARIVPLFSGRLEVTELVLQHPTIHLEVGKDAAPNWSFGGKPGSGAPADAAALNRIGFSHLNFRDGEITYYDASSGKSAALNDVSLNLDMYEAAKPSLSVPLNFDGSVTYNGEKLKIGGRLENFGALMSARTTAARLSIGSNIINADFSGTIGGDAGVSGALMMGAHSVRSFSAWLGKPLPPGNGFGLVALEGHLSARGGIYSLTQTHLAFDSMNLNGDLQIDTNPKVLTLKGYVTINRLDVNPYLAPGASDDTVKATQAKAANPDAPLALGGLKSVNADLMLVIGEMLLPSLKLDRAAINVTLDDGVLKADFKNLAAYGGNGKGTLTLDASGATPVFHDTLEISGIKAQPFLAQMMGVNKISGTGAVTFDISSRGDSAKAIVKDLSGKGEVRFTDGAIAGADLAAVARVLQSVVTGDALAAVIGESAKTPFGKMGASFTIDHGVMQTKDFQLVNPAVEMSGSGAVDLAAHSLDFHFEPKAMKGIPGLKLVDIGVPFYVKGPWEKPRYEPDVSAIAKSVVQKLGSGAAGPLDLLTQPGLSLKSILGTGKQTNK